MKTAMQELYAEIEKIKKTTDTISITDIQRMIGNYYIEKEKEQIIDACIKTTKDCWVSSAEYLGLKLEFKEQDLKDQKHEAKTYYNETFNNHE